MKTLCYHCGNLLDIPEQQLDKDVICPSCDKQFCAEVFDQDTIPQNTISHNRTTPSTTSPTPPVHRTIVRVADVLIMINAMSLIVLLFGILFTLVEHRYMMTFVLICNGIVLFSIIWALAGVSLVVRLANDNCKRIRQKNNPRETHS
jgi:hypothetical protein